MTLQNGVNPIPTEALPAGTTGLQLVIDAANWLPSMTIVVTADVFDENGILVFRFTNTASGPLGVNKFTGLPITAIDMNPSWGTPARTGWMLRASYTLTNGPLSVPSGSITLLP